MSTHRWRKKMIKTLWSCSGQIKTALDAVPNLCYWLAVIQTRKECECIVCPTLSINRSWWESTSAMSARQTPTHIHNSKNLPSREASDSRPISQSAGSANGFFQPAKKPNSINSSKRGAIRAGDTWKTISLNKYSFLYVAENNRKRGF